MGASHEWINQQHRAGAARQGGESRGRWLSESRSPLRTYFTPAVCPAYTGESHFSSSGRVPLITPKNSFCNASAIGPRRPLPMVILSIDRIGVILETGSYRNYPSAIGGIT